MAELRFFKRSRTNWLPAAYATNETTSIFNVAAGDLIAPNAVRVRTAFDGTSPSASFGDGDDVDRFMTTTEAGIDTTGLKLGRGGSGGGYILDGKYLYTAADTIDIVFTAATGSPTAGALDWWVYIAKIDPH